LQILQNLWIYAKYESFLFCHNLVMQSAGVYDRVHLFVATQHYK
jgi:hypothetical protein